MTSWLPAFLRGLVPGSNPSPSSFMPFVPLVVEPLLIPRLWLRPPGCDSASRGYCKVVEHQVRSSHQASGVLFGHVVEPTVPR